MEWIVLVAAVGGIATGASIIIFNLVSGDSDQIEREAGSENLERIVQREVDEVMRTDDKGNPVGTYNEGKSIKVTDADITRRCNFFYKRDDNSYPLQKWKGKFELDISTPFPDGTAITGAGEVDPITGTPDVNKNQAIEGATIWCDAIPKLAPINNAVDAFDGNPRTNRSGTVTWWENLNVPTQNP